MKFIKRKVRKESNVKKSQLVIVGSLILIIMGLGLIGIKYYYNYRLNKQEEKQADKFIDSWKDDKIVDNNVEDTQNSEENTDYVAVIEIPRINLKKGIYAKDSSDNDVNKNIEILDDADMPNVEYGNFILAGHSGSARTSYFKNLHKLSNGDAAYIYYDGIKYAYKLMNSYEIEKTGEVSIVRNGNKTALTLITCKDNSNKQLVFIFELVESSAINE